jgi:hypothetical protein
MRPSAGRPGSPWQPLAIWREKLMVRCANMCSAAAQAQRWTASRRIPAFMPPPPPPPPPWAGTWASPVPIAARPGARARDVVCAGVPGRPHAGVYMVARAGRACACGRCGQVFALVGRGGAVGGR